MSPVRLPPFPPSFFRLDAGLGFLTGLSILYSCAGGLPGSEPAAADTAFESADQYYFASISRLQRLWAAIKAPHADLSAGEIQAAQRFSEHCLHLQRRHRRTLASAWEAHTRLTRLTSRLSAIASDGNRASDAAAQLPPQHATLAKAAAQQAHLDRLVVSASAMASLASCAAEAETAPTAHASLSSAASTIAICAQRLSSAKLALDAQLGAVNAELTSLASPGLADVVTANRATMADVQATLSDAGVTGTALPGLTGLQAALAASVADIDSAGTGEQQYEDLQPALAGFSVRYESAVRAVLLWAQALKVS